MRLLFAALIACQSLIAPASAQGQTAAVSPPVATNAPQLRIGVRGSARPFSYSATKVPKNISTGSGPIRAAGFDGYMVYVCDDVLKQMLIAQPDAPSMSPDQIVVLDVDDLARDQREAFPDTSFDRLDLLGDKIDILCDPASINPDRVKRFAVSPPLFITGVGYLTLKGAVPPAGPCQVEKALIGFVGATNAASQGIRTIVNAGEWRSYKTSIIAALRDAEPENDPCPPPFGIDGEGGVFWEGNTHDEVARRFCNGDITYYVGDLEIITEHAGRVAGCDFSSGAKSFTTDRYAVFAQIDYQSEPEKAQLIGRFYEVLNREIATSASLLDRAFIATFGEAKRSQKLELFFWAMRGVP